MADLSTKIEHWLAKTVCDGKPAQYDDSLGEVEENILKGLKEVIAQEKQLELAESMASNPKSVGSMFLFTKCVFEGKHGL